MIRRGGTQGVAGAMGLGVGLALILPLVILYAAAAAEPAPSELPWSAAQFLGLAARSVALAGIVAAVAVVLGYVPGRILGAIQRGRMVMLALVLAPLVIPRHVLYYIWSLPLSPTTDLGRFVAAQPQEVAQTIAMLTTSSVLVLGYWPLAALLVAHGWRNIDGEVLGSGALDAGPWQRFVRIHLPLMAEPLALAWAACFVLVLSEYATFHLAGVETLGAQLAIVYELTGSAEAVARAAWPLVVVAAAMGAALAWGLRGRGGPQLHEPPREVRRWQWGVVAALAVASLGAPLAILLSSVRGTAALGQFWSLQRDGLANSLLAAAAATVIALAAAAGVQAVDRWGRAGRVLAAVMGAALLAAMFLPGSLVGAAILRAEILLGIPAPVGGGWWLLAMGQAARFTGVVLVIFRLTRDATDRHFDEMAGVDGAGWWAAWWHVRWPRVWPLVTGAGLLALMLSLTEVPATMMLLAPGSPNFTQRLLNQMHYARDQHVIASCLALMGVYLVLVMPMVLMALARLARVRGALLLAAAMAIGVSGCEPGTASPAGVQVLRVIGTSGRGPGEFLYPRAIGVDAAGDLYVADRTGRIQHFSGTGKILDAIRLPETERGYPTGLTVAPDGRLYVADTHYHRVLVYGKDGRLIRQFGSFGTGDGQFIYPTHVAVGPDGRIFVSEYGGNDRVSVWSPEGRFRGAFGKPGSGTGEFSRPSALALDARREILYVTDACNHRVARYTLAGRLVGYFGSVGTGPGEFRYPYGLALAADGRLVVCENGNNRVQIFSPEGASLKCLGCPGREPGQLAYPWSVAVDRQGRVFVVDAGNNRIQVWAL